MSKLHASNIYFIKSGLMAFANATMFTTYALYYVSGLGLNPFELVLVGTFLELTILLLEIPTGVVADTYSRRLSVILGVFIVGIAYILEGSIPFISEEIFKGLLSLFIGVVIAEIIRGVGETFLSGAQQAWLADEVGVENLGNILLKGNQINQVMSILGVLASVGLSSLALNLPYLVGGILYVGLGLFLLIFMPEKHFTKSTSEDRVSIHETVKTFNRGFQHVKGRPILISFLFMSLFIGAGSEGFDRLWEAHFITTLSFPTLGNLSASVWFGIISILVNIACFITAWVARKYLSFDNETTVARFMLIFTFLRLLCVVSFSLAGSFEFALISYLLVCMAGTITGPLYDTWINQNIESKVRATVLSLSSQMNALGQTVGGPIVGAAASQFTLRTGLSVSALIQVPILIIYLVSVRKNKNQKNQISLNQS